MKIRWTIKAFQSYIETLDYWEEHNKSYEYSKKIASAVNDEIVLIKNNYSFLSTYIESLDLYRKIIFKGKFSIFYRVDIKQQTIWIIFFRSNKQKPIL